MTRVFSVVIALLFCFACFAIQAQELPEPTEPPVVTYFAEIVWGSKSQVTEASWTPIPITVASDTESRLPATHSYKWTRPGVEEWEFEAHDSTATAPITVKVTVDIKESDVQGTHPAWGFYRLRIWAVQDPGGSDEDAGDKSEMSKWVPVRKPLGKPKNVSRP